MKRLFALMALFLVSCGSPSQYTWERYGVSFEVPGGYEIFDFDANAYHPEADPYNSALYINEEASNFINMDSREWTRMKVHDASCEDAADREDREWLDLPNGQCLEYKIGEGDEALAETVLDSITFE